eukprot:648410-Pelagomonas_calceolata.AAC.3
MQLICPGQRQLSTLLQHSGVPGGRAFCWAASAAAFRSAFNWLASLTACALERAWSMGFIPCRVWASLGPCTGFSSCWICGKNKHQVRFLVVFVRGCHEMCVCCWMHSTPGSSRVGKLVQSTSIMLCLFPCVPLEELLLLEMDLGDMFMKGAHAHSHWLSPYKKA